MNDILEVADEIKNYLLLQKEVKCCTLSGSLANNSYDEYSDIDIEIDVSGYDNSQFIKEIPTILGRKYPIVFCDYAPSLMPEQYVVSVAIDEENPFRFIDIKCIATPHRSTLQRGDFVNDKFEHTLKLWIINLKHWLRQSECKGDIVKMARKVLEIEDVEYSERQFLEQTLIWLEENMKEKHIHYVGACRKQMNNLCQPMVE